MAQGTSMKPLSQGTTSNRTPSGKAAQGCRVVHVAVPEAVFNHAKAQAYLSGIHWPDFVTRLLSEAKPFRNRESVSST